MIDQRQAAALNAQTVALRNAFTAGEADKIKEVGEAQHEEAAGAEREVVMAHIAEAHPAMLNDLPALLTQKGYRNRPFSRLRRWQIATAGSPSALVDFTNDTYKLPPIPQGETQQPSGEILGVSEIEIFCKASLLKATVEALVEQHGLRIHYHDGRPPLELPLADVLRSKVINPDAGVNGTGDAVVGSVTHIQGTLGVVRLEGRDRLIVPPGDSQTKLELFRYPEYTSAPTLTGETAALYLYTIFRGWRYAASQGKR